MDGLRYIDHINIAVKNLKVSSRFYSEVLGLKKTFSQSLSGAWIDTVTGLMRVQADCVFFDFPHGKTRLELICYSHPSGRALAENGFPHTLGIRHFAFEVENLDDFVKQLHACKVNVFSEPISVPFPVGETKLTKRLCYFSDPDGVLLEVAEYQSNT